MSNEQEATVADQVAWDWRLSCVGHRSVDKMWSRITSNFIVQLRHNVLSITFAYLLRFYSYQSCGWRQ